MEHLERTVTAAWVATATDRSIPVAATRVPATNQKQVKFATKMESGRKDRLLLVVAKPAIQIIYRIPLLVVTKLAAYQINSTAAVRLRQVPVQTTHLVGVAKVVFITAGAIQKVRSVQIRQFVLLCLQIGPQAVASFWIRSYPVCLIFGERWTVRRREFEVDQTLLFANKLITTNDDLTV